MTAPVTDPAEWLELAAAALDREIAQAIADYVEDYGTSDPPGKRSLTFLFREDQIKKLPEGLRHVASLIRPHGERAP